jgi:hypothetical protein
MLLALAIDCPYRAAMAEVHRHARCSLPQFL